jgi:outer membrane protein assembly factor BamB
VRCAIDFRKPSDPAHREEAAMKLSALGVVLTLAIATPAGAAIRYFHWDKPHAGDRGNVTALDLSTGKVIWQVKVGKSVNFVHETSGGVLLGNDDGEVVLLEKADGKVIWRCRVERTGEIKTLVADTEDGFFVASGDSLFWLVSRDGKLLLRCNDTCSAPRQPASKPK